MCLKNSYFGLKKTCLLILAGGSIMMWYCSVQGGSTTVLVLCSTMAAGALIARQ